MAAAQGEKKMITLWSSDGEEFEVEEAVAMESQTIRHMIEDDCVGYGIPLPNVNSKILCKVIEYCNKHVHAAAAAAATAAAAADLKDWDADFVKVDQATLFDLILAAKSLKIKGLLDLTISKKVFTLRSCDGEVFMVEGEVAMESQTIRHMIEGDCAINTVPLPNVTAVTLSSVIEYCRKHVWARGRAGVDMKKLDDDFIKVNHFLIFDLIRAASYMEVEGLLNLASNTAADLLGRTQDRMLKKVVERYYTSEEEKRMLAKITFEMKGGN